MNILVIGGTVFVGRYFAEAAIAGGHSVTLFHRGSKGPIDISGAKEILGDREKDLDRLTHQSWDAVVDTCGYFPGSVRATTDALGARTGRYLFVSTVSVYERGEDGELKEPEVRPALQTDEVTPETYGPLKAECERALWEAMGERGTIVRPGIVAGPHDPTNRFTYWVDRFSRDGEVLVPAVHRSPLQLIDARDLGQFMVHLLEANLGETRDVTGEPSTFEDMIGTVRQLNPNAKPVWASEAFLEAHGVSLWGELPLALPSEGGPHNMMRRTSDRALAEGLTRRSLWSTARDTEAWATQQTPGAIRHGLDPEKEQELLAELAATAE